MATYVEFVYGTLLYGQVFDYPYTIQEVIDWNPKFPINRSDALHALQTLIKTKKVMKQGKYYYPFRSENVAVLRTQRVCISLRKIRIAMNVARLLLWVPTIMMVGVSGSVAVYNAKDSDDIDLFICARHKTVWITRFITTVLVSIWFKRRTPQSKDLKDTVCLNMFVSENALGIAKDKQDLYTAHEVLQFIPLWDRNATYATFLKDNIWTMKLYPNKWKSVLRNKKHIQQYPYPIVLKMLTLLFRFVDPFMMYLQLGYMKKRQTSEIVTGAIIQFHPNDAHIWISKKFRKSLGDQHLVLDKDFFRP